MIEHHTRLVEQLFTAASELGGFRSFEPLYFHNVPYGWLYRNYETYDRERIDRVMRDWTSSHRLIFVGDASMAPYELFTPMGANSWNPSAKGMSGLDWLMRMRTCCPSSIWLNPDPMRWWNHPTVRSIGRVFPMYPLTLVGLRDAVRTLRIQV